jgi:hypothetical protein
LLSGKSGTYFKCGQLAEQALHREEAHAVTITQYDGDGTAGVAVAFVYK